MLHEKIDTQIREVVIKKKKLAEFSNNYPKSVTGMALQRL